MIMSSLDRGKDGILGRKGALDKRVSEGHRQLTMISTQTHLVISITSSSTPSVSSG